MPRQTIQGVDFSYDPISAREIRCLRDSGIGLMVQCLWTALETPPTANANIRRLVEAGVPVAGYISINSSRSGDYHVAKAKANIEPYLWGKLRWISVDVELDDITVVQIMQARNALLQDGIFPVPIYTSYNVWTTKIIPRNSTVLARDGALLWNAYWDNDRDVDFGRLPFGGWTVDTMIGEQYTGDTPKCGHHLDRNTFFKDVALPAIVSPPEEENDVEFATVSEVHKLFGVTWKETKKLFEAAQERAEIAESRAVALEDRLNSLICLTSYLGEALREHFKTHNSSGGVIERGPAIEDLYKSYTLITEIERARQKSLPSLNVRRRVLDGDSPVEALRKETEDGK